MACSSNYSSASSIGALGVGAPGPSGLQTKVAAVEKPITNAGPILSLRIIHSLLQGFCRHPAKPDPHSFGSVVYFPISSLSNQMTVLALLPPLISCIHQPNEPLRFLSNARHTPPAPHQTLSPVLSGDSPGVSVTTYRQG